jgi:cell wall-associated NlpC family hydrolase
VQEIPIVAAPKVATKDKSKNASAAPLVQKAPLTGAANDDLPPPIQIDAHTVQVRIGNHAGRVGFTVKKPPAPLATTPASSTAQAPTADGKRDAFIQAAMNLLGTRYLANSADAAKGLDGVGLISICLRRVGALAKDAPELTADGLNAMFQHHGGTADKVPDDILPGDIAWFGTGTHDVDAQQHPMIFLGGSRVVGPIPDAGPNGGAVQVIHIKDVPEHFAGWAHIEDLGTATVHTEHPGEAPKSDKVVSGALLPAGPSIRYDALKQLAADKKAPWFDDKGKVNLVGVKNLHDRAVILPEEDGWNDTIFAAYLDDDGNKCCIELRASVNPGTDKNRAETWQLIDGGYKFKLAPGDGLSIQTLQPDGEVKGWFDEHGAGALRPGELRAAAESGKKPA